MTESTEGYKLELKDVVLEVVNEDLSSRDKYMRLLNGVSTTFESRKVAAVMGASGSGKTTLMSLIAGRLPSSSKSQGFVLFRGEERDPKKWLSQMAYLEQDDCVVPNQTVSEYIHFSIGCRTTKKQRGGRAVGEVVSDVMRRLHIDGLKDTTMTAISGGERKRVMIAVEFGVGPDVLLLDEATSGLDSHLALDLVQMVKSYAMENNKIVIMTIHQPGPGLFDMLDSLLFLYKGSTIYTGPIRECEAFFSSKGIHRVGKLSESEFLFELFSKDSFMPEIKEYKQAIEQMADSAFQEGVRRSENKPMRCRNDPLTKPSFSLSKALRITGRQWVLEWRSWGVLKGRIVEALILAFYICLAYPITITSPEHQPLIGHFALDVNEKDVSESAYKWFIRTLKARIGDESLAPNVDETIKWGMYSFLMILSLISPTALLDDVSFIGRETAKGTYGASTLYFSMWIMELPLIMLRCLMYFGFASISGITDGNTPTLIAYVTIGSFLATLFNMMIRSITSTRAMRVLMLVPNVVFMIFLEPTALYLITKLMEAPEAGSLGYLRYLKYPMIVLWPHCFFQGFMKACFLERVLYPAEPNESFTAIYKAVIGCLVNSAYNTMSNEYNKRVFYESQTRFLVDLDYPKHLLLVCAALSLVVLVLLSIWSLGRRFSPSLRLKLSAQ